ncbi:hypothetical protein [Zooshikella ganghwensis]|uniref:hypothetical protein n=1 Tax=Zooshikella ganghwensis TaxID=202772 RepID=UPI001B7F9FFE|nr:hypothetical protein [Zooshikella ganghwensis]
MLCLYSVQTFLCVVKQTLLDSSLQLESAHPHEPIIVSQVPEPWQCLGVGNYAAVFVHPQQGDWVVKVYAHHFQEVAQEASVYRQLGKHPAYSELIAEGDTFLVLKRLYGVTLYDAVHQGSLIPERVITDITCALAYAQERGLNPFDVHGKNVMMQNGQGFVVDISDFYKEGYDPKWEHLRKAYYCFYRPIIYRMRLSVPYWLLDMTRYIYRQCRKLGYLIQQIRKPLSSRVNRSVLKE